MPRRSSSRSRKAAICSASNSSMREPFGGRVFTVAIDLRQGDLQHLLAAAQAPAFGPCIVHQARAQARHQGLPAGADHELREGTRRQDGLQLACRPRTYMARRWWPRASREASYWRALRSSSRLEFAVLFGQEPLALVHLAEHAARQFDLLLHLGMTPAGSPVPGHPGPAARRATRRCDPAAPPVRGCSRGSCSAKTPGVSAWSPPPASAAKATAVSSSRGRIRARISDPAFQAQVLAHGRPAARQAQDRAEEHEAHDLCRIEEDHAADAVAQDPSQGRQEAHGQGPPPAAPAAHPRKGTGCG